jgi:hypothetical protein
MCAWEYIPLHRKSYPEAQKRPMATAPLNFFLSTISSAWMADEELRHLSSHTHTQGYYITLSSRQDERSIALWFFLSPPGIQSSSGIQSPSGIQMHKLVMTDIRFHRFQETSRSHRQIPRLNIGLFSKAEIALRYQTHRDDAIIRAKLSTLNPNNTARALQDSIFQSAKETFGLMRQGRKRNHCSQELEKARETLLCQAKLSPQTLS